MHNTESAAVEIEHNLSAAERTVEWLVSQTDAMEDDSLAETGMVMGYLQVAQNLVSRALETGYDIDRALPAWYQRFGAVSTALASVLARQTA